MYNLAVSDNIVSRGDEYIVHVDEQFHRVLFSERAEHTGHSVAEGGGRVAEAEVHDSGLV